jgi:hypothetical protein
MRGAGVSAAESRGNNGEDCGTDHAGSLCRARSLPGGTNVAHYELWKGDQARNTPVEALTCR